jgi:SAM-dependent methyltransferase
MRLVSEITRAARRTAESLRSRGTRATTQAVLAAVGDYTFDWRFGTDTRRSVSLSTLQINSDNRRHGVDYSATKPRVFAKFLARTPVDRSGTFVDLGCGKGRVLLLAAEHGFRRAVGVEFSPELCRVARSNIAAYCRRRRSATSFAVQESDVTRFSMRDDEAFFFLFNPFDLVVMKAVLDRLEASLRRAPRRAALLYYNPICAEIMSQRSIFRKTADLTYAGAVASVYLADTTPATPR